MKSKNSSLENKKCIPCQGGVKPFTDTQNAHFLTQLTGNWSVVNNHHLEREYVFANFQEALDFTNMIGQLAEIEGHHPDIYLSWGKVRIQIWTHKIGGLAENDYILAAKCESIYNKSHR